MSTTEEQALLRSTIRSYLEKALPDERVASLDAEGTFPRDVWSGLADLGVLGIGIPPEHGGGGGGAAESVIVTSELARRFPSLAVDHVLVGMAVRTLLAHGQGFQLDWLAALARGELLVAYGISEPGGGTDALGLSTRAELRDGAWVVTGQKLWTSLANHADLIFTLARTDPADDGRRARGISLIAVPTAQPNVHVRKLQLASMRAANTTEVFFDGAFASEDHLVGARGRGFHQLRASLDLERLQSAALSIGLAERGLELAVAYARDRMAFGRPIGAFQAVQHPLADSAAELAAALALLNEATAAHDRGEERVDELTGMAKLVAAETAARVVDRGMRAMGAYGLSVENPMQMLFRDARLQLFSPVSNEMLRNLIGEGLGLPRSY